jgi:aryl-alcohol dehydrogenase-like predicted oxidoreductase
MRYNQLGRTGLYVSEICLGAMTFGGQGMWQAIGNLQEDESTRLVETALKAGVNFIDTADVYSEGRSETLVGHALKTLGVKRSDVVVATKVFGDVGKAPNDRGASRGHIMDGVKYSLDRLGLDHIDLYQIHGNDRVTPLEETMRALDDLVREGLVRYIGVSNWAAWKITKANMLADAEGWTRFATLQAYYSIAGRDLERELAPMMEDQRMGLMAWSPLAGGLLSGKFSRDADGPQGSRRTAFDFPPVNRERAFDCIDAMREIGEAHGVSVARVALAYILAKRFTTSIIVGAKTVEQLSDNLAAADLQLTPEDMAKLDEVSKLPPEYPGWMFERQGGRRIPEPFTPEKAAAE